MKRKLLGFGCALCLLFALCGCQTEETPIDISSLVASTGTNSEEEPVFAPTFAYTWEMPQCVGHISAWPNISPTPRGIMLNSLHGLKFYDPSGGVVTDACGDPLCDHSRLSNCVFSEPVVWTKFPVSDGQFFYFVHTPMDPDTYEMGKNQIIKCDLYGLHPTVLYETKNEIGDFYLLDHALFFEEYGSKDGVLLYRYDLDTGRCVSPPVNSEEGLLQIAFVPMGDSIYYSYDGDLYQADQTLSVIEKVLEDCPLEYLYTDGENLYQSSRLTGIYQINTTEHTTELVYQIPERFQIEHDQIEDGGISFRLIDPEVEPVPSSDYDGWIARYPQNSIYFYSFEEHACKEIPLGDLHVIDYAIYDGNLYMQEYYQGEDGRGYNGDWYVMNLQEGIPRLFLKDRNWWA